MEPVRTVLDETAQRPVRLVTVTVAEDGAASMTVAPTGPGWREVTIAASSLLNLVGGAEELLGRVEWRHVVGVGARSEPNLDGPYRRLAAVDDLSDRLEYCSIRRSDLAVATSLLDADSSPMVAPGRASPGWRHEVLADMATNLAAHDITVLAERAVVEDPAEDCTIGWLTTTNDWLPIIVRVDPIGEVFSRVDPDRLTL